MVQGTADATVTDNSQWRDYEFKGKPGSLARRPPQVAPYHLPLDWLMWFEAMAPSPHSHWFLNLLAGPLKGDPGTLSLMRTNPFPNQAPRYVRAQYYQLHLHNP